MWTVFHGAGCFFEVETYGNCACLRVAEALLAAVSGEVAFLAFYSMGVSAVAPLTR